MTTPDDPFAPPPQGGQPGWRQPSWGQPQQDQAGWGAPPPPPPPPPPYGAPPGYGQEAGWTSYPQAGGYGTGAPWGIHPVTGQPYSEKSKIVAGLLQFFLGSFGVGRFYTGHTGIAVAQLLTCGGLGIWALIDSILIFVGKVTDSDGRPLRD